MGGWALKLFCCDWDLDLVAELDKACGIPELEIKHGGKPRPDRAMGVTRQDEHRRWSEKSGVVEEGKVIRLPKLPTATGADDDKPVKFSMFEKLCSHPSIVREYLDSSGALAKQFNKLKGEANSAQDSWLRDPYGPGYWICMLGACGMTLGAKISAQNKAAMRKYYKTCGLMEGAVKQIEEALDPKTGYTDGAPWDFGSLCQQENMARGGAPKEQLIFPGCSMTNIWAPDHGRMKGEMEVFRKSVATYIAYNKPSVDDVAQSLASAFFDPYAHPKTKISSTKADSKPHLFMKMAQEIVAGYDKAKKKKAACRMCDAETTADGKALLTCAKCKMAKYCSTECQKKDWKRGHKSLCGTPLTGEALDPSAIMSTLKLG